MDVAARHDFWATMHTDADSERSVIFATHDLEEADAFADRIVLIRTVLIAVLPAFFFLIFGTTLDAKVTTIGNGNIAHPGHALRAVTGFVSRGESGPPPSLRRP